jgi:hypothetical protein
MTTEKSEQTENPRICENCACFHIQRDANNPMLSQAFCRRDPPQAAQVRQEVPRLRDGKPVLGRDGKTVMETAMVWAFLYKPTDKSLTCFDGWRELGCLPGDHHNADVMKSMHRLWDDINADRLGDLTESPLLDAFNKKE